MDKERVFTLSQVAQHKSKQDCWFIIDGRVLDVTEFLEEHPGGEEVLIESAGKDITKEFEEIMHSEAAKNLFFKYQVGYLEGYKIPDVNSVTDSVNEPKTREIKASVIKEDSKHKYLIVFFKYLIVFFKYFVPLLGPGLHLYYRYLTADHQ